MRTAPMKEAIGRAATQMAREATTASYRPRQSPSTAGNGFQARITGLVARLHTPILTTACRGRTLDRLGAALLQAFEEAAI